MQRACDVCGQRYEAKRRTSKYCSTRCRTRSSRGQVVKLPTSAEHPASSGVVATYRKRLAKAGRLDTPEGAHVMLLAEAMAAAGNSAAGVALLSRELAARMADAMRGAQSKADALDELSRRRQDKAAGA